MKQIEKNKQFLLKYGISEEDTELLVANGYTKTKIESVKIKELEILFPSEKAKEIKIKLTRQPIQEEVFMRLIKETELHCPFCWNILEEKPIIIHHIDPYNETQDNSYNNLIVLCLNHHADVHTKREISKNNYPKKKLLYRKEEWIEELKEYKAGNRPAPGSETTSNSKTAKISILQNWNGSLITEYKKLYFLDHSEYIIEEFKKSIDKITNDICNHSVNRDYNSNLRSRLDNLLARNMGITYLSAKIEKDIKDKITIYIKTNKIKINNSFFKLGQLEIIDSMTPSIDNDPYCGSKVEKEKYLLIHELYDSITLLEEFKNYINLFKDYILLFFVLGNNGSNYDENIKVKLFCEKGSVLVTQNFPIPEKNLIKDSDSMISNLYHGQTTHEIGNYPDYILSHTKNYIPDIEFFGKKKSENEIYKENIKDYKENIKGTFNSYEFYDDSDFDIITLYQNYLQHHTSNNFPSAIICRSNINKIQYEITTKNIPDKITGIIGFKK